MKEVSDKAGEKMKGVSDKAGEKMKGVLDKGIQKIRTVKKSANLALDFDPKKLEVPKVIVILTLL